MFSRILGTGSYLPKQIRTNEDLEKMVETSNQWIVERTGIEQRRVASKEETVAYMGAMAAKEAIESSNIKLEDIDTVICATTSNNNAFPSAACEIAQLLGLEHPIAFDVAAACAGFSYAYTIAHSMIISGQSKNVLVIGSDRLSHTCDPTDRTTIILFGDGAGAVVLSQSDTQGTLAVHNGSDPIFGELLKLPNMDREDPENKAYLYMKGNDVFKHAVVCLADLVGETLKKANMTESDLNFLVPHQANLRIIAATARKLKLNMDQVILTLDKHGNTSAASVPLALDYGIKEGIINRGDVLLLESFGGGFTWGAALVRY